MGTLVRLQFTLQRASLTMSITSYVLPKTIVPLHEQIRYVHSYQSLQMSLEEVPL